MQHERWSAMLVITRPFLYKAACGMTVFTVDYLLAHIIPIKL